MVKPVLTGELIQAISKPLWWENLAAKRGAGGLRQAAHVVPHSVSKAEAVIRRCRAHDAGLLNRQNHAAYQPDIINPAIKRYADAADVHLPDRNAR